MSNTRLSSRAQLIRAAWPVRVLVLDFARRLHNIGHDRRTQLRMRGERPVKADHVQTRAWDQRGQALHELLRVHHDVGRAVAIRAFEFQHDLALGVAAQAFVGERGAGDVAAQLFELLALIRAAAHRSVQAEAAHRRTGHA